MVADTLSRRHQQLQLDQPTSPARTAEDLPEEGLVAPEWPILAAIADAQPVDFSAMAAAQRTCPEVADMMNSTHCRSQPRQSAMTRCSGTFQQVRPVVPIQHREAVFQSLHSIHQPGLWQPAASSPLSSAGHRWPRP